jgi:hypothetical protein
MVQIQVSLVPDVDLCQQMKLVISVDFSFIGTLQVPH